MNVLTVGLIFFEFYPILDLVEEAQSTRRSSTQLAISGEASSDRVVGTMLKYKGPEFIKKLQAQEMKMFKVASTGFLDLMIAGEIAASPAMFRNMVIVRQERGVPVAWVPLDVSPANAGGVAVINNGPHPHAARARLESARLFYARREMVRIAGETNRMGAMLMPPNLL
jgi:hypothetical protein